MKNAVILLFCFFLMQMSLMAQDGMSEYNRAKSLINDRNYEQAMELLRPYLEVEQYGELSLYAHYHFARAAFDNQQFQLSEATLRKLVDEHNWKKEGEARYLLSLIYFLQEKTFEALTEIGKITDKRLIKEGEKASYDFLKKNASISFLVARWPNFKENHGYALALKEKLQEQTVMSSNEKRVFREVQQARRNGNDKLPEELNRVKNQTLDVAVILPFNYQGGTGVRNLGDNNFVFDLYQGIKLSLEEYKEKGYDITIRTFDTERKEPTVGKILDDSFMEVADVIIGPIYPEETEIVAEFSETHQIPFINPLSNIQETVKENDYAYLFRPSTEGIVKRILDYCRSQGNGRRVALAYSGTTRDELMARHMEEEASKLGFQIVLNTRVNSDNIRSFLRDVNIRDRSKARADQVIIFSDDPNIASPTMSMLESLTTAVPLFVMDSWLYFNFANFEMLGGNDFYFVGNNAIHFDKEETDLFREDFFGKYHAYPSPNAYVGYELMGWVAETINNKQGFEWRRNLDRQGLLEGKLGFGLDFRYGYSNQHIPILKLNEGKLEEK